MGNYRKPITKKDSKHSQKLTPPKQMSFWEDLFTTVAEEDCRIAGYKNGTELNNVGKNGNYWSSTLSSNYSNNARNLNFNDSNRNTNNNNRRCGFSVRPVTELTRTYLLTDLYKAYRCARKNKRFRDYQLRFEMNLEENLCRLCDDLINREYYPGTYVTFIVHEPKQREVFAAPFRDLIVHHLYYNYTHRLFERTFIADSYSCIKRRGTHYGVRRLDYHIRSASHNYTKECYIMKLDLQGYFMSINRKLLLDIAISDLKKIKNHKANNRGLTWSDILDFQFLEYLTEVIVTHNPILNCKRRGDEKDWFGLPDTKSLFHSAEGCGLPIGNLTSQLFSNVFLNHLDQYIKRVLKIKHYGRYVDDMFFVDTDKNRLVDVCNLVSDYAKNELKLTIHPQKIKIVKAKQGIDFLGQFILPYRRYLSNKSKKRVNQGINSIANMKKIESKKLQSIINSYCGVISHVRGYRYWYKTIQNNNWMFRFGVFNEGYTKLQLFNNQKQ